MIQYRWYRWYRSGWLSGINAKKLLSLKHSVRATWVTPWKQQKSVFYPTVCKTPDAPLQNELLCSTIVHLILLLAFILCKFLYHYVSLIIADYTTSNYVSSTFKLGQGEWPVISGQRWHMCNYELVLPYSIWLLLLVTIILCKLKCHSVWLSIAH